MPLTLKSFFGHSEKLHFSPSPWPTGKNESAQENKKPSTSFYAVRLRQTLNHDHPERCFTTFVRLKLTTKQAILIDSEFMVDASSGVLVKEDLVLENKDGRFWETGRSGSGST